MYVTQRSNMEIEFWDLKINQYVEMKITHEMWEHAYEEMAQRFRSAKDGMDALQKYVDMDHTSIQCDHCDSPKDYIVYSSYLVTKMLNMYIIDSHDYTNTEMCLWWLLWYRTKDTEINGVPT